MERSAALALLDGGCDVIAQHQDTTEPGNAAKEKGLVRSEGKEYVMQDGDVVLFRFNV